MYNRDEINRSRHQHPPLDLHPSESTLLRRPSFAMSSKAYDDLSKEERDAFDAAEAAREKEEQAGERFTAHY